MQRQITNLLNGDLALKEELVKASIDRKEPLTIIHNGGTMIFSPSNLLTNRLPRTPVVYDSKTGGEPYTLVFYKWDPIQQETKVEEPVEENLASEPVKTEPKNKEITYKLVTQKEVITILEETVELTMPDYIGYKVKHYREALGLNQTELHRKIGSGISQSVLSYIENGNSSGLPNLLTLQLIANGLGVTVKDLLPD